MDKARFAFFSAGFWANYQMAASKEIPSPECKVVHNLSLSKGEEFAARFGIGHVYDNPEKLLDCARRLHRPVHKPFFAGGFYGVGGKPKCCPHYSLARCVMSSSLAPI
jgi:hypothetical protein